MRADRFISAERVEGFEPPGTSLQDWMNTVRAAAGERVPFRARDTERGRKSFELTSHFARITPEEGGATVETEIPLSEIDYYAPRLLSVETDVLVEYPPELIEAIRRKTRDVISLYQART